MGEYLDIVQNFTPREKEIFTMLLNGVSPKEIAYNLGVKHRTVDFHRNNIYRKLGVQSIQELFAKSKSFDASAPKIMPVEMATPQKPFIMEFYDNSFYNSETVWQYRITPPVFFNTRITAGERYVLSYSFKSNTDFNFLDLTLVDNSPEANFFTVLGPPIRQLNNSAANTEYKNDVTFAAVKTASSTKPGANSLFLEINAKKEIPPILTFSIFSLTKS